MATPTPWNSNTEPLCGENDPYGRTDTANRYIKGLWSNLTAQHNEDTGSHKMPAVPIKFEAYSYTGNGSARTITLQDTSITILGIFITGTVARHVYTTNQMTVDDTKEVNTAAYQNGLITNITTQGEFEIGTDNTVNQNAIVYNYLVWGY